MQSIELYSYKIPEFYLTYIYNADDSGLDVNEKDLFDQWYERVVKNIEKYCNENNIPFKESNIIFDCSDGENFNKSYFTWYADIINKGCQVIDCNIILLY